MKESYHKDAHKIFGKYLLNARLSSFFTLRDVEEKTGISNSYLSQIERGLRKFPSIPMLIKLGKVYNLSLTQINKAVETAMEGNFEQIQGHDHRIMPDNNYLLETSNELNLENRKLLTDFLDLLVKHQLKNS